MLSLKTLRATGMTALLLATSATTALAADMLGAPPPPPVPMAAPVLGGDSGFYLRGDIGYGHNTFDKMGYYPRDPAQTSTVDSGTSLRGSFIAGVGVGYQVNSWLRTDVTGEYRSAGKFKFRETGIIPPAATGTYVNDGTGSITNVVGLVNAYVDLGTWNRITPYVGVGVGMRATNFSGVRDVAPAGAGATAGVGSDGYAKSSVHPGLAWALHAGAAYDMGSNWKLDLGYRYLNTGTSHSSSMRCRAGSPLVPNPNPYQDCTPAPFRTRISGLGSHDVRIGVRYLFADAAPAPSYAPSPLVRKY